MARRRSSWRALSGNNTGPGRTALTRTFGASSTANMRVSVGTAPLEMK